MRRTPGHASDPINGEYVPLAEPDAVRAMSAASPSPLMSWLGAVGPAMFFGTVCLLIVLVIQQWFFVVPAMTESTRVLEEELRARKEERYRRGEVNRQAIEAADLIERSRKQALADHAAAVALRESIKKLAEDNAVLAEQVKKLLAGGDRTKGGRPDGL